MLSNLQRQVTKLIYQQSSEQTQREAIMRALTRPGFVLNQDASCRAGVLALETYNAIAGSPCDAAEVGAAGVELLMESCFMFDHVGDQEVDPRYGFSPAEELSLAIAILSVGMAAAYDAERTLSPGSGWRQNPLRSFFANFVSACAGQYLDVHMGVSEGLSTDDALRMTTLKSGSLGTMVAGFCARLATDDSDIIYLFEEFGFNLLTYLQLIDDLRDACPSEGKDSDYVQNKQTVPLAYFYNTHAAVRSKDGSGTMSSLTAVDEYDHIKATFEASGALAFGAVIAEAYLNRAKGDLAQLAERLGSLQTLEHILTSVEIAPQELLEAP